ncbi:MAG: hypothetical protein ACRENX_11770 [Candidatus Dormibacteria bacterium]
MAEVNRGGGANDDELRIRSSEVHRRRAAFSAGTTVGAVLIPVGLVLTLLSRNWAVLLLCLFATILVAVASYIGQGHNEIFVGPRGIRRVVRNCDLVATWASLESVEVTIPGNRIVVFTVNTTGVTVERLTRGHSNQAENLVRHPPEGFQLRFERQAADALVGMIAERRPRLKGIREWEKSSRPN